MKLESRRYGNILIEEDEIVKFEEGIPGFEGEKEFIILQMEDIENFYVMHSVNDMDLSFILINPLDTFKDYDVKLEESTLSKLKIEGIDDVEIYSLVVIPEDITKATTNLVGPLIINRNKKLGKQVILNNTYTTKHYIFTDGSDEKC